MSPKSRLLARYMEVRAVFTFQILSDVRLCVMLKKGRATHCEVAQGQAEGGRDSSEEWGQHDASWKPSEIFRISKMRATPPPYGGHLSHTPDLLERFARLIVNNCKVLGTSTAGDRIDVGTAKLCLTHFTYSSCEGSKFRNWRAANLASINLKHWDTSV